MGQLGFEIEDVDDSEYGADRYFTVAISTRADYPFDESLFSFYLNDYETLHEELNATYVGDLENINMGEGTHLYGYSLSLDGSIGVNFYMKLEDTVVMCNGKTRSP